MTTAQTPPCPCGGAGCSGVEDELHQCGGPKEACAAVSCLECAPRRAARTLLLTDAEIDAIEARANAATPGPWVARENPPVWVAEGVDPGDPWWEIDVPCPLNISTGLLGPAGEFFANDASFVARVRADVPALIAALRAERRAHTEPDRTSTGPSTIDVVHELALLVGRLERLEVCAACNIEGRATSCNVHHAHDVARSLEYVAAVVREREAANADALRAITRAWSTYADAGMAWIESNHMGSKEDRKIKFAACVAARASLETLGVKL